MFELCELHTFKAIILGKEISIPTAMWAKRLVILIAIPMEERSTKKLNFRNHCNKVNDI
jgi:hypothetical protein